MDFDRPQYRRYKAMNKVSLIAVGLLAGCGLSEDASMEFGPYINLDAQPDQLRSDFNAHAGQVRLVFIVGPT